MATVSWVEVLFTVPAVLVFAGWLIELWDIRHHARTTSRIQGYHANGPRARMHRGDFVGALIMLWLIAAPLIVIGAEAMLTPPAAAPRNQTLATLVGLLLFVVDLGLLAFMLNRRATRRQVNRAWDRAEPREELRHDQ